MAAIENLTFMGHLKPHKPNKRSRVGQASAAFRLWLKMPQASPRYGLPLTANVMFQGTEIA